MLVLDQPLIRTVGSRIAARPVNSWRVPTRDMLAAERRVIEMREIWRSVGDASPCEEFFRGNRRKREATRGLDTLVWASKRPLDLRLR